MHCCKNQTRWFAASLLLVTFSLTAHAEDGVDQVVKVVSDDWNSLEVVKLIIDLLIPAAMLYLGLWFDRRIKEIEHRQWSNQSCYMEFRQY